MGRRGNMRSRPGLLFVIVFVICLVIFYLSWHSIMSPDVKVKDTYSMQRQSLLAEGNKWRNKPGSLEGSEREDHDRDPDYDLDDSRPKLQLPPALRRYEESQFAKEEKFNTSAFNRANLPFIKTPEKLTATQETNTKGFYRQPVDLITGVVTSMERLVHLDLKGAAPKISYFKEFLPLVKQLGATGLLIEYEDMFPYTGKLRDISAKNAYSLDDINELLKLAKNNDLIVMPLIQTFGHMEFVLRSDFAYLRESDYTPQVISITKNESYDLISEMVKQVLNAHPEATHLHIGCDEVYELGRGASGVEMQNKKLTESQLFLRHVQHVASIVRGYRNVKPVIWDDELRKMPSSDIETSRLSSLVEIMVWQYSKNVSDVISNDVWDKYAKVFKSVWIASAFKGATGARQLFTEAQHHIQNHFSWLDVIAANRDRLTFKGVALTGWQRYDHFGTLCELLPVSVPSLAVCLATMFNAGFTEKIHMTTSKLIGCSRPLEMTLPLIDKKTNRAIVTQDCRFPGHEIYYGVQELYGYVEGNPGIQQRLEGWLSDYQVAHEFSNPGQLKVLSRSLGKQSSGFSAVSNPLRKNLADIYFEDTVEEWIEENILERQRRIDEWQNKIQDMLLHKTWPRRPLSKVGADSQKSMDVAGSVSRNSNFPASNLDSRRNIHHEKQYLQNKFPDMNKEVQKQPDENVPGVRYVRNNLPLENQDRSENSQILKVREDFKKSQNINISREKFSEHRSHLPFVRNWENDRKVQNLKENRYDDGKFLLNLKDGRNNTKDGKEGVEKFKEDLNPREKTDDGKADIAPERYRPVDVRPGHVRDIQVNPQLEEDDKMRRKKYINEEIKKDTN